MNSSTYKLNSSIIINKDPLSYFTHGCDVMWYLEQNTSLLNQVYELNVVRNKCIKVLNKLVNIERNFSNPKLRHLAYSNWAFRCDKDFKEEDWFEIIYFLNRVFLNQDESNLFNCMVMNGIENDLYVLKASDEFWEDFYTPMSRSLGFEIRSKFREYNETQPHKLYNFG